jgi:hypothetical protein
MSNVPPNAPPPGAASPNYPSASTMKQLNEANFEFWMDVGRLSESMDDVDRAKTAYESAIKHKHDSISAKKAIAMLYKDKLKQYDKVGDWLLQAANVQAIEFLQSCLHQTTENGDIWALLGMTYFFGNFSNF